MVFDLSSRELALAVILLVCDAFGLVIGARILARRPARGAGLLREGITWFGFGMLWAGVWGIGTLLVLRNRFALLRVVTHVVIFVMAPLAVARGIAWIRAGRRSAGAVPLAAGLAIVAVYLWAFLIEPGRIEFSEHRISSARLEGLEAPVRIAILADIQTDSVGDYEAEVFRRTSAMHPDLVLLPGDFVQVYSPGRFDEQAARFRELFALFDPWPRLGVFAVMGDVDPDSRLFDGTRVRQIDDQTLVLADEPALQLVGLSLTCSRSPFGGEPRRAVEAFSGFSIVMGHAPDYAQPVIDGVLRPEMLCVAGHTHGGQIVVPGFGPPLTLTSIPRRFAAGGMFALDDAWLCVSRGVGLERGFAPRVRLFCRPQVVIVDLVPEP